MSDRLDAVREASRRDPLGSTSMMEALLRVLSTPEEPDELRLAALATLQQCSLLVAEFQPYTADFTAALRTAIGSELAALREQAMDLLALNHDPYVQEMLVDGLRNPQTATVAPEQALRMLGYDVHAEHYGLLQEIVDTSRKPQLRRMALRLLAADSGAKDTFARIAADRSEDPVRPLHQCGGAAGTRAAGVRRSGQDDRGRRRRERQRARHHADRARPQPRRRRRADHRSGTEDQSVEETLAPAQGGRAGVSAAAQRSASHGKG